MNFKNIDGAYIHRCADVHHTAKIAPASVVGAPPLNLDVAKGRRVRKPFSGGVKIDEWVDIGSNCSVVYGTYRQTHIGSHTFIGHNCTIGHDSLIGENVLIGSGVHVLGEVVIEPWCVISSGSVIQPKIRVLEGTYIGGMSLLVKGHYEVPSWSVAYGNPCKYVRPNQWRPPA